MIVLVAQAMASMDEEILVIAAPSLSRDLHASNAELQLVLAMYTVAFAALFPGVVTLASARRAS